MFLEHKNTKIKNAPQRAESLYREYTKTKNKKKKPQQAVDPEERQTAAPVNCGQRTEAAVAQII